MHETDLVIVCVTIGVAVGILLASCAFIAVRFYRKRARPLDQSNENGVTSLPIRANGIGTSMESSVSFSHSNVLHGSSHLNKKSTHQSWWSSHDNKDVFASVSNIPRYSYKDIQKATQNFTTILGQGSFGPVYKAVMPTSEVVAVKVLASNSRQGEKEFQTEVLLLARLHHRNLVNLTGYCVDKGQHMLVYEFMSNGSLSSLLYTEGPRFLSWEERVQIALDVSHATEYLHEGAVPPVIHRDLKSANILLDQCMRAKVADFGLSKEESYDGRKSGLKGTFGYIDPEYLSTNKFTKKSDVYSFGIILLELITAINPQQGLLEYVNLAVMDEDGKGGWDEILDKQLVGNCDLEEVRLLASTAYRCVHKVPRKRPSIVDVSQAISRIQQRRITRDSLSSGRGDVSRVVSRIEHQQIELSYMTSIKEKIHE